MQIYFFETLWFSSFQITNRLYDVTLHNRRRVLRWMQVVSAIQLAQRLAWEFLGGKLGAEGTVLHQAQEFLLSHCFFVPVIFGNFYFTRLRPLVKNTQRRLAGSAILF